MLLPQLGHIRHSHFTFTLFVTHTLGHSFETLVTPLRGGKTPNLAGREIGKMEVR